MRRCFELARLGAGSVSPNPMVGAVLVHEGRIIGEGWHRRYGEAHAEVNCLRSVPVEEQPLIRHSTLYCNLEPCFHHGKTPPCVDLVLEQKIPRVVISNADPNPLVAGQSIEKLRSVGVEVMTGILEADGAWLNRCFFTWIGQGRPYLILKWAQSSDGFIGRVGERVPISDPPALRLVHRWRSEVDAVLVGTNTAMADNPRLDTRFWPGDNAPPLRVVLDSKGRIPADFHLLDDGQPTWVLGRERSGSWRNTRFYPHSGKLEIPMLLELLAVERKAILLVEGGAQVLQQFLDGGWWDEIRVMENARRMGGGVAAPLVPVHAEPVEALRIGPDVAQIFRRLA